LGAGIDLFFMIGLPRRGFGRETEILQASSRSLWLEQPHLRCRAARRYRPEAIFGTPKVGYRFFSRTLKEHRQAMLMPSWKFTLNYETKWMTRDEIARVTYEAALDLIDIKEEFGVIGKKKAAGLRDQTQRALTLVEKITDPGNIDNGLREEIFSLNTLDQLCDKHELDWPIKGWKLNVFNLAKLLLRGPRNGQGRMPVPPPLPEPCDRLPG
jgi:hypothetical protein